MDKSVLQGFLVDASVGLFAGLLGALAFAFWTDDAGSVLQGGAASFLLVGIGLMIRRVGTIVSGGRGARG